MAIASRGASSFASWLRLAVAGAALVGASVGAGAAAPIDKLRVPAGFRV